MGDIQVDRDLGASGDFGFEKVMDVTFLTIFKEEAVEGS